MNIEQCAAWMDQRVRKNGYLYQEEAVDWLYKNGAEELLRENADGNMVLGKKLLAKFLTLNADTVVWVRSELHWRMRDGNDEPGRQAAY